MPENGGRVSSAKAASNRISSANRIANENSNKITEGVLNHFIKVQSELDEFEDKGIFEQLSRLEDELDEIERNKKLIEINHVTLGKQTKKDEENFRNMFQPHVQRLFNNQEAFKKAAQQKQMDHEKSANLYIQVQNELDSITALFAQKQDNFDTFRNKNSKAIYLYEQQLGILNYIFEGDFGSELENKLEKEVLILTDLKDLLTQALGRWKNAKILLSYAYTQFKCSEEKWFEMMHSDPNNQQNVLFATEVKNNLEAAYQNLLNTKNYLKNVELPFCTQDDLKASHDVANGVINDMKVPKRHDYVLSIIQALRKRCAALNQWFDQVIKDSLAVDYIKAKFFHDEKSLLLKLERIRLLQEKIKEKTGKDIKINIYNLPSYNKDENFLETLLNGSAFKGGNVDEITEKPLSEFNLPPPPSSDQILGEIQQIKQRYFDQLDNWNQHLDSSKREAEERLNNMLLAFKQKEKEKEMERDKEKNLNDPNSGSNGKSSSMGKYNLPDNIDVSKYDRTLGDIEEIKKKYFETTDDWNRHLDLNRKDADDRLSKMLLALKQKDLITTEKKEPENQNKTNTNANANANTKENDNNKNNKDSKENEKTNKDNSKELNQKLTYDLTTTERTLGDVEEIKKRYYEDTDNWSRHLDSSKRDADEKLNKLLSQYKK